MSFNPHLPVPQGMWKKFLGASQCYMYIHPLSRQIVSLRPEDFQEEVVAAKTEVRYCTRLLSQAFTASSHRIL